MKYHICAAIVAATLAIGAADALADTATKVAAGEGHTCALTTSGGVVCWGHNGAGQLGDGTTTQRSTPTAVTGLGSGVAAIAAGDSHPCALTTGGGVVCWGNNGAGQLGDGTTTQRLTPTAVTGLSSGVAAIAAGEAHTCAVTTSGGVACWGTNARGQLGDGTTVDRVFPTAVNGLGSGVAEVSAGRWHSCALTTGGGVVCWGYNGAGQLGDGTTTQRLTPTAVSGLGSGVAAIAAGHYHTCALTAGGAVLCWGGNHEGPLGDGTTISRSTPTPVTGLGSGVAAIATGGGYTCALTTGGGVLCWGWNGEGELGDGTTTNRLTPTPVSGLSSGVTAIAAGAAHTCAVTTGGSVACWGWNGIGQLGDGRAIQHPTPTAVSGLGSGVAALAAGQDHTCALTTGGGTLCWGDNFAGQLGDGTTTGRSIRTAVSGLGSGVAAIAAGQYHTCALTMGGGVLCWGGNWDGELGDGTTTNRLTPTPVSALGNGVATVAAGSQHSCAVTTSGGVLCWGYNSYGQLGDGTTTRRLTPTPVNGLGSGVGAIAAGQYHTCALTTGGGVVCWGYNVHGQLGDGTTTSRPTPTPVSGLESGVATVASGSQHTCALTTNGGVLCWGINSRGELGDGTTTERWTPTAVSGSGNGVAAIAAGGGHTCALTASVGVLCWGANVYGELGLGGRVVATSPIGVYGFGGALSASSISPATGPVAGGTAVTISGAYFLQGGTVMIGGVPATNVIVVNTETTTATTGAHLPGAVDVVIQNPDGAWSTLAGGFTYQAAVGGGVRGDFTGDLKSDVLWRHARGGDAWLWPMDGAHNTAESYVRTVGEAGWEIRGMGDQTGDWKADILWRHAPTGMLYLWTMNGKTIVAETYLGTVDPAYDVVGTGDYNGDGKSDILWRRLTNGELWVWLMDGAMRLSSTYVATIDPGYAVVGSSDLNGDSKADIVWRHKTNGEVWVWLMNGATPTSMTYVTTVGDIGYQIVGVADHTGDGKADILWRHTTRGEVWLWPMNGTTLVSQSYVGMVPDTGYRIVGNGDYNGDGKADILWHHATRGEVWVWLMDGTTKRSETWVGTVPDVGYQIVR